MIVVFFFNDTSTTEIYTYRHTLSLHDALPISAIQLTPDFELAEYKRQSLVYEKEDLLISGTGKYPDYNFYRVAGMSIAGKPKGTAANEAAPVDVKGLLP